MVDDRDEVLGDAEDGMVAPKAGEYSDAVDEALQHLVSSLFSVLHNIFENRQPYILKRGELGEWPELTKC